MLSNIVCLHNFYWTKYLDGLYKLFWLFINDKAGHPQANLGMAVIIGAYPIIFLAGLEITNHPGLTEKTIFGEF
jgi:hypothetical protein